MSIWQLCSGSNAIRPLSGQAFRLVESQEQIATMAFVDTLEEQAILEQLLDSVKPPVPFHAQGLHYLLSTPFRYPPLKWGSRFGSVYEPSLFYAGTSVFSTMAEAAFYRQVYLDSMSSEDMPTKPLSGQHTLFSVGYSTQQGVQLHQAPFSEFEFNIRDRVDYSLTQQLGADMRSAGVLCFEYPSARCNEGINVALFEGSSFTESKPNNQQRVMSATTVKQVELKNIDTGEIYRYDREQFCVDGRLPLPA